MVHCPILHPPSPPSHVQAVKHGDLIFVGQYLFTGSESTSVWLEVCGWALPKGSVDWVRELVGQAIGGDS